MLLVSPRSVLKDDDGEETKNHGGEESKESQDTREGVFAGEP